jgi:hypothetical protein
MGYAMTLTQLTARAFGASIGRQTRKARLKSEYSELYPGLRPGEWETAAVLADRLLADCLLRGSEDALRGRVLPDEHFEFRDGASQGGERDGMRLRREVA